MTILSINPTQSNYLITGKNLPADVLRGYVRSWWFQCLSTGCQLPLQEDMRYLAQPEQDPADHWNNITTCYPWSFVYGRDFKLPYDPEVEIAWREPGDWTCLDVVWWKKVTASALSNAFWWWLLGARFSVPLFWMGQRDQLEHRFQCAFSEVVGASIVPVKRKGAGGAYTIDMTVRDSSKYLWYTFMELGVCRADFFQRYPKYMTLFAPVPPVRSFWNEWTLKLPDNLAQPDTGIFSVLTPRLWRRHPAGQLEMTTAQERFHWPTRNEDLQPSADRGPKTLLTRTVPWNAYDTPANSSQPERARETPREDRKDYVAPVPH